ncbi:MAG: hypothetical protein JSV04_04185 [Candidatus Heimdallarchaeota archaeon]|nr:MAG: hypothetical protein JSV04_04185 [Candidatus Heimdallarchaeota archaeon]
MTEENLTNMEITILEIISQHRDIHFLNILAQIQQMFAMTSQSFDKNLFKKSLTKLEKEEYIKRLISDPETFGLTQKGGDILE